MNAQIETGIPAHVPPELVRTDYPMLRGVYVDVDPYEEIIPNIPNMPRIFYSTNAYPGRKPSWVVTRGDDLRALFLDTEHFTSVGKSAFSALIGESWSMIPLEMDPPAHSVYRALLNPLFSPKKMNSMADSVQFAAWKAIAKFRDKDSCEFMSEFAFPFPVSVFLDLMDLPHEEADLFMDWEKDLMHSGDLKVMGAATRNVVDYMRRLMTERRKNPKDDFISYCLKAQIDGRPLTEEELTGTTFTLFIGGMDTVTTNMGLHFRHLATRPDHQRALRVNPELIPSALEELLRAYGATGAFRTCYKEVEFCGVTIKPGEKILASPITVCRDPSLYDAPNEVRFDRNPTHLTFAQGIHHCIGASLARRELKVALEEFLAAIPEFRIEPGARIRTHLGAMVQPETLPLVWHG